MYQLKKIEKIKSSISYNPLSPKGGDSAKPVMVGRFCLDINL